MVDKKSWEEFRASGMLWLINVILNVFGWAITYEYDELELVDVYPARTKFRGFSDNINTDGYIKVSEYLHDNIDELLEEAKD